MSAQMLEVLLILIGVGTVLRSVVNGQMTKASNEWVRPPPKKKKRKKNTQSVFCDERNKKTNRLGLLYLKIFF